MIGLLSGNGVIGKACGGFERELAWCLEIYFGGQWGFEWRLEVNCDIRLKCPYMPYMVQHSRGFMLSGTMI
jgi:hypothetical protein